MSLSRYAICDAYTLEELRRNYHNLDIQGRINLLQTLNESDHGIPFEIAVLAVEDQNVQVRQWLARYGEHLDFSELRYDGNNWVAELP